MPSGRAGMQGHLPPPPSEPSRESGMDKNAVGPSSPHPRRAHGRLGGSRRLKHGCGRSGRNGRPVSSRGASAPGLYRATVSRRQPGHAVTFPRASVATGHRNMRSHHLRTASSGTQAEPGGRAGGGTVRGCRSGGLRRTRFEHREGAAFWNGGGRRTQCACCLPPVPGLRSLPFASSRTHFSFVL